MQNPKTSTRKYRKKLGNGEQKWLQTRRIWMLQNRQESYNCYYCGRFMHPSELTLDHYKPRGSHPELRYELSNLVACCWSCNGKKGSVDGDIFIKEERWKPN